MRVNLTSIFVDDQEKAFDFYVNVLGFIKKTEIPEIKWYTVVSPEDPDGPEIVLEPSENPASPEVNSALQLLRDAMYHAQIPATSFAVVDIWDEYERLRSLGVRFTMEPKQMGPVTVAVFDDGCGNLIQLAEMDEDF
jgi:catechol 2,3-dioxygenase-like lactoylglutathione lyase family enzyme